MKSVLVISRMGQSEPSDPGSTVIYGAYVSSIESDRLGVLTSLATEATFRNLMVRCSDNDADQDVTHHFTNGETHTALQVVIPAGQTGDFYSTGEVTLPEGALFGTHILQPAGTGSAGIILAHVEVEPTDNTKTLSLLGGHNSSETNVTYDNDIGYTRLQGTRNLTNNGADADFITPIGGTLSHFGFSGGANLRVSGTIGAVRINGVVGNLSLTHPALTSTLSLVDTVNEDTLVAGDNFQGSIETGAGAGEVFNYEKMYANLLSSEGFMLVSGATSNGVAYSGGDLNYLAVAGQLRATTTESDATVKLPFPIRVKRLFMQLSSEFTTASNGTLTATLRKNGVDTAATVSIDWDEAGEQFYIDTDLVIAETDEINYAVSCSSGTQFRLQYVGMHIEELATVPVLTNPTESDITTTTATVSCDTDTP